MLFIRRCTTARNPDSSFHSCLTCRLPSVNEMSTFGSEAEAKESQRTTPHTHTPNSLSHPMLHKLLRSLNVSPIDQGGKGHLFFSVNILLLFSNRPRPFFFPTPPHPHSYSSAVIVVVVSYQERIPFKEYLFTV